MSDTGAMRSGTSTEHAEGRLKARFLDLWQRQGGTRSAAGAILAWSTLETRYAESHRRYHNMSHLAHCLAQFDSVSCAPGEPDAVEMAIWFHDVIHEPGQPDNEARSAELFAALAAGAMVDHFIVRVVGMIEATTHQAPPSDHAECLLCDIDLSSFGMPWAVYLADSVNLMHEFRGSREAYYQAQRAFLDRLLERPRIFLTDVFHQRFETQARANIAAFIALLERRGI